MNRWAGTADPERVASFQRVLAKGRKKTSAKAVSRYTTLGPDGELQIISDPPFVEPISQLAGMDETDVRSAVQGILDEYRKSAARRPQGPARRLPGRRRRAQGRGRRARSAPGAGSPCSWARMTPPTTSCCSSRRPTPRCWNPWDRAEHVRQPRPPRRGGPAADAGIQRHAAGLDPGPGCRRRVARLLRAPDVGLEDLARTSRRWTTWPWRSTRGSAAGRWPVPMPAAATGTPSPPTSGRGGRSPAPCRSSPTRTPTRTRRDYEAFLRAIVEDRIPKADVSEG